MKIQDTIAAARERLLVEEAGAHAEGSTTNAAFILLSIEVSRLKLAVFEVWLRYWLLRSAAAVLIGREIRWIDQRMR